MKRRTEEIDAILDDVTAQIRTEAVDSSVVETAAARVWAKLSAEQAVAPAATVPAERIQGCADFQSLIPAYLGGTLSEARALLLEDHTHECIPCRKALKQARSGGAMAPAKALRPGAQKKHRLHPAVLRWGIAAALAIGIGSLVLPLVHRFTPFGETFNATVQAADGLVFRVSGAKILPVKAGERIPAGAMIRTAKDSDAVVRLADGSLIEMRGRSELSLTDSSQGTTIHLDRGNIVVEAARQRARHLYVATEDSLVSVKGTIFSVNSGTRGSRVSVIDGEVRMERAGRERVLRPGDQAVTQPSLEDVPVKDEIAWSRNADRYVQLLTGLSSLRKELNNIPRPGLRNSTRLLDLAPERTVFYAALPNLSATLGESHRIMQERIQQNAALRDWWEKERAPMDKRPGLDQMIERVRQFGEYLGDEITLNIEMDESGKPVGPLVLAELKNSTGFRPFLEEQMKSLSKNGPAIRIIDDPLAPSSSPADVKTRDEIFVWINGDLLAASPKPQQLQQLAARLQSTTPNNFTGTQFYRRMADLYREGTSLVVAADLEKIVAQLVREGSPAAISKSKIDAYRQLGLLDMKHFIVEQKESEGKTNSRAVLSFNEQRRGIASWLAAPGPMGALEYISPDANVAAAFVVKEPVSLVDDLLGFLETVSPGLRQQLSKLETEHGLNIRNDFAAPLGGEFAFAIDGPILPTPSWKMVFEVNDPARLQQTFEHVVDELNRAAAKDGGTALRWGRADIGGDRFYTLKSTAFGLEANYTFINGYLVIAPSRALVDRALRYRESGYTLLHSPRFTAALPADRDANFSALFYHDLAPLLQPLAQRMAGSAKNLPEEQQKALEALAADLPPTVAYAYAQGDRITFAANTEGGPFGLSPASLLGMPSAFGIQHILREGLREKTPKQ